MKNTYSSWGNSIINDNIKTSQDFELSVIIFLAKHPQIPVASAHIDNTMVDNICNPVEHVLLYSPDTALINFISLLCKKMKISGFIVWLSIDRRERTEYRCYPNS